MIWKQARGEISAPYLPARAERTVMWQARSLIALYGFTLILVLFSWSWIFWCWMLSLLLGQPFLRAYLLAEHGLCPQVVNMFENTHTTFTNRVIRFLAWNMSYHAEHHAYPAVRFYKLAQFHALTRDQLVSTSDGCLRFHMEYRRSVQD